MADKPFAELVGSIINNCGVLEFFIYNTIKSLSKDPILFNELVNHKSIPSRLRILRQVLQRAGRLTPELESLISEIRKIMEERNLIAHNPIGSDDALWTNPYVLVVKHDTGFPPQMEKLDRIRLDAIAERSRSAMAEFLRLLPGAIQLEPFKV